MGRNIIAWAKKILSLQVALSYLLLLFSTSAGAATLKFEYDQAGNMISGQGRYYEYNDGNQLVKVRKDAPSGPVIAEYVYDYQGQRVKKIENGITTYYIGKQYEERKGNTVNEKTNYIFVNGQRVAASIKKDNEPAKISYYLNNHLGSADVVVDEQGNVTDKVRYYPYGEYRTQPNAQRHTYTGKERDEATEQYYYEARYYNPFIRRFAQADTITPKLYDPQSLNRYAYVRNNPIRFIDPSGHADKDSFWSEVSGLLGKVTLSYSAAEYVSGITAYRRYATKEGLNMFGKYQGMVKNTDAKLVNSYFKGVNEQLGYYSLGVDMTDSISKSVDKVKSGEGSLPGQIRYNSVMLLHKSPAGIINAAAGIVDLAGNSILSTSGSEARLNVTGFIDKTIESRCDSVVRENRAGRMYDRLKEQNMEQFILNRPENMNWFEHNLWLLQEFYKD